MDRVGAHILVAEDQEHVREALAMLLRGHGYSVALYSTPQQAISAAQEYAPDLAMLDMNYQLDSTSGREGLDLIQRLREVDPMLPIIALTAWGNVDLAVKAMKFGASDFIEKPWNNDALLSKVESLTARGAELRRSHRISEYEQQNAHQLQTRIVPRRHLVTNGIELFGDSVPAGIVGGDYFGVFQPTPEILHVCVADVSGKGTPGALIAAMLYASVSTLSQSSNSAEHIVSEVEAILRDQLGDGHFVTMLYAVLNLDSHTLEYVNAGHCPPMLQRFSGVLETLLPTRQVLGLMLESENRSERITLVPGDRLAIYTDGIVEATNEAGEEVGAERLAALVGEHSNVGLEEQHHRIMDGIRRNADGKFSDDATLLLIAVLQGAGSNTTQASTVHAGSH